MATHDVTRGTAANPQQQQYGGGVASRARRLASETKASIKTSELYAYIAAVIGVLIAGNVIEGEGGPDIFAADKVWLYVTVLTVGYMISRGLAKSGSRDPYWEDSDQNR